ncbi:MAG: TIR domain-containing protein [Verrucomicrobiota bacterium]|jgi:TolB-like protein/tetratricopeptide (TPR) repeat protein|nr:TIR domain-containing protein [Verrucomicrobiota bacterium]
MTEEVFISYGSADRERIQDLVSRLRQAGVTVWIDEAGIEGAAMWSEEIVGAINHCKVLILAISPNSTKSKNVVRELALASEEEKTILPVFIEPTDIPESMKYQLAGIQRVEYFAGNEQEAIGSVLRALSRLGITTTDSDTNQELGQAPAVPPQAKGKSPALAIAAVAVIALLAVIFLFKPSGDAPSSETYTPGAEEPTVVQLEVKPLDKNRIVLLPFKNIGTPGENDHIVEGIVDDLNTMLTNVEGLKVIGSASAKTYRNSDKTPAEIGQELNAGTLLQGSIQKTGSDLKINVRLIDTTTSENIWANSFSGSESDRSKFQQEIIQSIVNKTKGTILNQSELSSLTQGDTESAEAYNLVKEGVDLLQGHSREGTQRAIDLMLQAIELDPNYSNAYMGLARAYQLSSSLSLHEPTTAFKLAKKYGRKALEINPNLPGFEIIKITFSQDGQRDPEEMMNRLDSLLKKYPNNSDLLREAGDIYSFSGRNQKAIETLNQGLKLDPKNAWFHQYLAYSHLISGDKKLAEHHNLEALKLKPNFQFALHIRSLILSKDNRFDEVENELLKAIQDDAQNPVTMMSLGIVYWRSGQKEKSYKLLAELLDRRNFEYIKSGILTRFYIAIGEKDKSLKWLQESSKESDTDFVDLFHWPLFDEVRSDPEFIKIYKDAGIYEHFTTGDSK